jgi:hypothetical protein
MPRKFKGINLDAILKSVCPQLDEYYEPKSRISMLRRIISRKQVNVSHLEAELDKRNIPHKGLLKPALSELTRQALEKELLEDTKNILHNRPALATLRSEEIKMAQWQGSCCYKNPDIIARLKTRSLKTSGRKPDLIKRLCAALVQEREAFWKAAADHEQANKKSHATHATGRRAFATLAANSPPRSLKDQQRAAMTQENETQGAGAITAAKSSQPSATLTQEQRIRIEENRKRALELRLQHQAKKQRSG